MAAAPTIPFVTEEQYLNTAYEFTTEYVDGSLVRKSVNQLQQGKMLMILIKAIALQEDALAIAQYADVVMKVAPGRFRAPDLMLLPADHPNDKIVRVAPLVTVEVLGKDDKIHATRMRVRDHIAMGVQLVLVVDPVLKYVETVGRDGLWQQVAPPLRVALELPRGTLMLDFDEMFAKL